MLFPLHHILSNSITTEEKLSKWDNTGERQLGEGKGMLLNVGLFALNMRQSQLTGKEGLSH